MKWSAFKEIVKTFAILAFDLLGFFAVLALLITTFVFVVVGVFSILWLWLDIIF